MKNSDRAQSATSLPRAPRDELGARSNRYLVMMGVRIACFILMVVITPYGWYTWVLGAAAILIPYIAVVSANVGEEARRNRPEDPQPTLAATPHPTDVDPETHPVLRLHESADSPDSPATTPDDPDSDSPAPTGGTA